MGNGDEALGVLVLLLVTCCLLHALSSSLLYNQVYDISLSPMSLHGQVGISTLKPLAGQCSNIERTFSGRLAETGK